MLDFFSQKRLRDERVLAAVPKVGQFMPDFAVKCPDGRLMFLSAVGGPLALLVLNSEIDAAQTHLLQTFAKKCREVRPEVTRSVVVTCPEHLSTVVALAGDAQILSDDTTEAVLQLAPETSTLYILDARRRVVSIDRVEEDSAQLVSALRSAA